MSDEGKLVPTQKVTKSLTEVLIRRGNGEKGGGIEGEMETARRRGGAANSKPVFFTAFFVSQMEGCDAKREATSDARKGVPVRKL